MMQETSGQAPASNGVPWWKRRAHPVAVRDQIELRRACSITPS
jgi:hypothetical protein